MKTHEPDLERRTSSLGRRILEGIGIAYLALQVGPMFGYAMRNQHQTRSELIAGYFDNNLGTLGKVIMPGYYLAHKSNADRRVNLDL